MAKTQPRAWLLRCSQRVAKVMAASLGITTPLSVCSAEALFMDAHMGKAEDAGTGIGAAVKSFDAAPIKHLQHLGVWLPQLAKRTHLNMEQE